MKHSAIGLACGHHPDKRWLKKIGSLVFKLVRALILIGLGYIVLYPIIFMISTAFRGPEDYYDPTVIWLPIHFSLGSFAKTIKLLNYWNTLRNTAIISIGVSMIQTMSCALTGYGLARYRFKGKWLIIGGVILTIIVPSQTIIIPLYEQYRFFDFFGISRLIGLLAGTDLTVNLTNSFLVYFLPAMFANGLRSGLFILVFMQTFRGFPESIEDAAFIDGCGHFRCFLSIIIPNAVNAFVTIFLFGLVWHWNDYYYSGMLMGPGSTLSLALRSLSTTANSVYNNLSDPVGNATCVQAGCLLMILPILLVFFFGQSYFVESVERTGLVE